MTNCPAASVSSTKPEALAAAEDCGRPSRHVVDPIRGLQLVCSAGDPVVCAYLRSVQQRLDDDRTGDAATAAQLEQLADVLDRISDA